MKRRAPLCAGPVDHIPQLWDVRVATVLPTLPLCVCCGKAVQHFDVPVAGGAVERGPCACTGVFHCGMHASTEGEQ